MAYAGSGGGAMGSGFDVFATTRTGEDDDNNEEDDSGLVNDRLHALLGGGGGGGAQAPRTAMASPVRLLPPRANGAIGSGMARVDPNTLQFGSPSKRTSAASVAAVAIPQQQQPATGNNNTYMIPIASPQQQPSILPGPGPGPGERYASTLLDGLNQPSGLRRAVHWLAFALLACVALGLYGYCTLHATDTDILSKLAHQGTIVEGLVVSATPPPASMRSSSTTTPTRPQPPPVGNLQPPPRYPTEDTPDRELMVQDRGGVIHKQFAFSTVGPQSLLWPDVSFSRLSQYDLCCHINDTSFVCGDLFSATLVQQSPSADGSKLQLHLPLNTQVRCRMRIVIAPPSSSSVSE